MERMEFVKRLVRITKDQQEYVRKRAREHACSEAQVVRDALRMLMAHDESAPEGEAEE